MSEVIKINSLSKAYKRVRGNKRGVESETFWALRDINANINQGEVVGFIGKNGAGKSTLLKILSRITSPSSGSASLFGRVGSLLEVGTGFHPEMTGRENIFMNGNILGMRRNEIAQKLDSIIEFSGVSQFIDTPIKRYSSGMQARLAFSVAAHLEPEILIVDEVLAVGDAEFQKRCLGKMREIGQEGRTVLFVSHNMNAVRNLCSRCIWLKNGQVAEDSERVDAVVNGYLSETTRTEKSQNFWVNENPGISDSIDLIPRSLCIADEHGSTVDRIISCDELLHLKIEFECLRELSNLSIGYALYDSNGNLVYMTYTTDSHESAIKDFKKGLVKISSRMPLQILNDGDYTVQLIAGIHQSHPILSRDGSQVLIQFTIQGNASRSAFWNSTRPSAIAPVIRWNLK